MSLFNFLPIVGNCCLCIKLKLGSILIAILGILGVGSSTFYISSYTACGEDNPLAPAKNYVGPILIAAEVIICIGAIIFLIGICTERKMTADIFLFAIAIGMVIYLLYAISAIIIFAINKKCQKFMYPILSLISVFIWIYFMMVIRSFKEEME